MTFLVASGRATITSGGNGRITGIAYSFDQKTFQLNSGKQTELEAVITNLSTHHRTPFPHDLQAYS